MKIKLTKESETNFLHDQIEVIDKIIHSALESHVRKSLLSMVKEQYESRLAKLENENEDDDSLENLMKCYNVFTEERNKLSKKIASKLNQIKNPNIEEYEGFDETE
jgi:uncharacterized protein (DUF1778 family)